MGWFCIFLMFNVFINFGVGLIGSFSSLCVLDRVVVIVVWFLIML